MRRSIALIGTAALALALTGCGDDEGSATGGTIDPDGLVVVAQDIDFDQDRYEASAGEIPVGYRNEGSLVHTLVIEDVDGLDLEVQSKGDTASGTVTLEPGEYVLFCDVPGHQQSGMEATLTVR